MCKKRDSFAGKIYPMKYLLSVFTLVCLFCSCKTDAPTLAFTQVKGETMGTYYTVTYRDSLGRDFKTQFDSILAQVNAEVSTYEPQSTITIFNKTADSLDLKNNVFSGDQAAAEHNKHFITNLLAAKQVYEESNGAFDPTVMPLVNYWGFGYTPKKPVEQTDTLKIDSLMRYVGFEKITFRRDEESVISKQLPGVQLDFSACAKGYGVDAVGRFLSQKGLKDYYVEIGGESLGSGNGKSGDGWTVAVAVPKEGAATTDFSQIVRLRDKAIATSGNYINFYEVNGNKYAHTINPKTGYPQASNLLSATVFTDECMMSDAYATACMVMGSEAAQTFIEGLEGVEGMFIYADEKGDLQTKYTTGARKMTAEMK